MYVITKGAALPPPEIWERLLSSQSWRKTHGFLVSPFIFPFPFLLLSLPFLSPISSPYLFPPFAFLLLSLSFCLFFFPLLPLPLKGHFLPHDPEIQMLIKYME